MAKLHRMWSCLPALAAAALFPPHVCAAIQRPTAYYNPATGHLRIVNDIGRALPIVYMQSISGTGFVTDASAFGAIPNAAFDPYDLPLAFAYLPFPQGTYDIGNVVVPGTPIADLKSDDLPTVEGPIPGLNIVLVPEPAGGAFVCVALILLARRRML